MAPPLRRRGACSPCVVSVGFLAFIASVVVGTAGPATATPPPVYPLGHFAVGEVTQTLTDTSRSTAAWGAAPALPSRTLVTTILYPATGSPGPQPVPSATPDGSAGPYPLVVFAHGLGASPQAYLPLLEAWASAGYVVAAPLFPLTSSSTPGGPDAGDVVNQPKDVSYVISAMLFDSVSPGGTLTGLLDANAVGVAGHSNGGVTVLGLVTNTCCHDSRVKAAIAMAGTTIGMPGGRPDNTHTPPLLLVHGTADQLIPYRSAPIVYDAVRGPKGVLTIHGGSHEAAAGAVSPSSTNVIRTTTDFLDVYLRGDTAALSQMAADARSRTTSLHFDAVAGSTGPRLPIPAPPVVHLQASVTPHTNLTNGEAVTVRWSGYTPGKVVNVLECYKVNINAASASNCDFANASILQPDPKGRGSLTMHVATGKVGSGTCGPHIRGCAIVVNNASSTLSSESRIVPITFASS